MRGPSCSRTPWLNNDFDFINKRNAWMVIRMFTIPPSNPQRAPRFTDPFNDYVPEKYSCHCMCSRFLHSAVDHRTSQVVKTTNSKRLWCICYVSFPQNSENPVDAKANCWGLKIISSSCRRAQVAIKSRATRKRV